MDLSSFYSPATYKNKFVFSDKRDSNKDLSGTTEITQSDGVIKVVTSLDLNKDSPYPAMIINEIPISLLQEGTACWQKNDEEYGVIKTDMIKIGDSLICHFQSENGEHRGSSIIRKIDNDRYKEVGFAYNAPNDVLKWESIISK